MWILRDTILTRTGATMSEFEDLSAEAKEALRLEFETRTTPRERRVSLVMLLQEGANESKMGRPCPMCKNYPFFAPHDEALIEGHVYSHEGLAEIRITGYCEFCFDRITMEPDEEEETDE
jgi:hypothetical protein